MYLYYAVDAHINLLSLVPFGYRFRLRNFTIHHSSRIKPTTSATE